MATFYLLPSRPVVGERLARALEEALGVQCERALWSELADALGTTLQRQADHYVVFGDDLPSGEDPRQALGDAFGAEDGDEIIIAAH